MSESKKIPIYLPIVLGLVIILIGGFWTGYELEKLNNLKYIQDAEIIDEQAFPPNAEERYADFKYVFEFVQNNQVKKVETEAYPHKKFRVGEKDAFYYDDERNIIVQYPYLSLSGVLVVFVLGIMSFLLAFFVFIKEFHQQNKEKMEAENEPDENVEKKDVDVDVIDV